MEARYNGNVYLWPKDRLRIRPDGVFLSETQQHTNARDLLPKPLCAVIVIRF